MKINISLLAIIVTILISMFGWMVSVEVRMSQNRSLQEFGTRLQTLENNILPLLVEYKVQEILKTKQPTTRSIPTVKREARTWADRQMVPQ